MSNAKARLGLNVAAAEVDEATKISLRVRALVGFGPVRRDRRALRAVTVVRLTLEAAPAGRQRRASSPQELSSGRLHAGSSEKESKSGGTILSSSAAALFFSLCGRASNSRPTPTHSADSNALQALRPSCSTSRSLATTCQSRISRGVGGARRMRKERPWP